jgi:hypothetical protein
MGWENKKQPPDWVAACGRKKTAALNPNGFSEENQIIGVTRIGTAVKHKMIVLSIYETEKRGKILRSVIIPQTRIPNLRVVKVRSIQTTLKFGTFGEECPVSAPELCISCCTTFRCVCLPIRR